MKVHMLLFHDRRVGTFIRFGHHIASSWTSAVSLGREPKTALSQIGWSALLCVLALLLACKVHAQTSPTAPTDVPSASTPQGCLPGNDGYLRARLKGSIDRELDWGSSDIGCTGAVRPVDGGIRMRFTHKQLDAGERLVLVFGITRLREGQSARAIPVNVTVIREGSGEFYGTQGDDKCMLDEVTQTPLVGIPNRTRSYRVTARGYCLEPARAVRGKGAVLISRFDYAGRVDFETEDDATEAATEEIL